MTINISEIIRALDNLSKCTESLQEREIVIRYGAEVLKRPGNLEGALSHIYLEDLESETVAQLTGFEYWGIRESNYNVVSSLSSKLSDQDYLAISKRLVDAEEYEFIYGDMERDGEY